METILASALRKSIRSGALTVTFASGRSERFGDGSGPAVAFRFADARAQWAFMIDPDLRFGELYMSERLALEEGSIRDLLGVIYANAESGSPPLLMRAVDFARFRLRRLARNNVRRRSRTNVAHHYDLDARLFRLFLDDDLQYSCAYFPHPSATLEEAQAEKKRRIVAKLDLGPGMRVLDIGSGWGGSALTLAQDARKPDVLGVTLSSEQLAVARARAAQLGLGDRAQFRLEDYRDLKERFDRITSVGMFEHVGVGFYGVFFRQVAELLAPDGVMLLHTIGSSDAPGFVTPWLDKYIFPGGDIPSLSEIIPHIEKAGLVVTDVEVLRKHYALTLREWARRFQARRADAAALYDERFCRMWEFYLAAAECAFLYEGLVVFQIQIAKTAGSLPLTRDYMKPR